MPKAASTTIIRRSLKSPPASDAVVRKTEIEKLWTRYLARVAEKQLAYADCLQAQVGDDDRAMERTEAAYSAIYDDLWDIERAIQQSAPVSLNDLAIKAQAIVRRDRDLGGPSDDEDVHNFCRDVQIAAGFVSSSEARL